MNVCTVIAKNYAPAARVLARSLAEHHPDVRLHALVIDDFEGYLDPAAEPFEVVRPAQLGIPRFEWMAAIYDVLELSTAVKPWLMRHLLERSPGVVYLDPDIRVYASLREVFQAVEEHGLVLNPHNTGPMPRDGRRPNEQDILIAGAYNLGFIGLRQDDFAEFFLDWWAERLETDCIVDPARGFFVDQRWVDLVPGLARDFHLVRDPGFNLAYWNLASRELAKSNGHFEVDGGALRLFHFSGFSPDRPHELSRHQNRIDPLEDPPLLELCEDYARELREAGYDEASNWPYTYGFTPSGFSLGRALRTAYRRASAEEGLPTPFSADGERKLIAWCNAPAAAGAEQGVTRFIAILHECRPDRHPVHPQLSRPEDARGFIQWLHEGGRDEMSVPDALLPGLQGNGAPAALPAPVSAREGVNVAGYLRSESGVGEVGRQAVRALQSAGVETAAVALPTPHTREGHDFAFDESAGTPYGLNLVCVNADQLPLIAAEHASLFAERYSIGLWWWELASFPPHLRGSFAHLDEVWAGSRFVADALARVSPIPVLHMPTPVSVPDGVSADRRGLGLPDGFVFLFSFDFHSVFKRKNPLGLIQAFSEAFGPGEDVHLVVKSINGPQYPAEHERLRAAAAGQPNVHLIEDYLDPEAKYTLTASCDAYVSLHRSEGFGLGLAEALLLGKPVIATGYGGNTDFVTEATGYPVRWSPVDVGPDAGPYDAGATWADPDLEHASELMRRVVAEPDDAAERTRRGGNLLRRVHSHAGAGDVMADRLRTIQAEFDWRRTAAVAPAGAMAPRDPDDVVRRIQRGPVAPPRSALGPVGPLARRLTLRLMKPYTAHADTVQQELAELSRAAERRVDNVIADLRRDAGASRAAETREVEDLSQRVRDLTGRIDHLAHAHPARFDDLAHRIQDLSNRIEDLAGQTDELRAADPTPRIDDLARQADELRAELDAQRSLLASAGVTGGLPQGRGVSTADLPDAPAEPWSEDYNSAHAEFVTRVLDDPSLTALVRRGDGLPDGYGTGFDERVVEYPWVAAQHLSGVVLDAGSTLNHAHVLARLRPRADALDIATLAPEERAFPQLDISYLYADLRELPIRDGRYDRIVSISTLEHVGLDNSRFGADAPASDDPQAEALAAMRELHRVLRPGGDLYLTVPVGRGDRFPWVRSLTHAELDELIEAFAPATSAIAYFRHTPTGWRRSDREETADARYRDHLSGEPPGEDRTVAAEAIACVHLVK